MRRGLIILALCIVGCGSASATGGSCPGSVPSGINSCFYASQSGADTNTGTSEASPWLHIPGMVGCSQNCSSVTPAAGQGFILRGNDVWANGNFPIMWGWSGTSSSGIYVGVDTSWYSGSTWNRPVFNAGGSAINAPDCPSGSGVHYFLYFNAANYVEFQWIEMKGLYWNNDQQNSCYQSTGFVESNRSDNLKIDNFYFHDWTHGTSSGTTDSSDLIAFTTYGTAPYCNSCYIQNSVIDNSDGDGASAATTSGGGVRQWNLVNNIISHVVQGFLSPLLIRPSTTIIAGNDISNINESFTTPSQNSPPHPNCIETTGVVSGGSGTAVVYIHDNYIHNIQVCEGMQVGNPNEDDYAWNNIWDMGASGSSGENGPQVPQSSGGSHNFYFWNNTVRWASGCMTAGIHSKAFNIFMVQNNHCINDGSIQVGGSIPGAVVSNNVAMTNATATSQGYTTSETYVFSPSLATNSTIGAGTNLSANWPTGYNTNDTNYACMEQTIQGVVQSVCPVRSNTTVRSSTWDAGAYLWTGSVAPAAPTGLVAVVH